VISDKFAALFETRLSKFLGSISFPLYLVQVPVLCSFGAYLRLQDFSLSIALPLVIAASISAAVAVRPIDQFAVWIGRSFSSSVLQILRRPLPAAGSL